MLHVEVAMNKRKAITVNPYASEVYNFKECLNAKHPDWEEFVLNTQKKQLKQHFVKIGDRAEHIIKTYF